MVVRRIHCSCYLAWEQSEHVEATHIKLPPCRSGCMAAMPTTSNNNHCLHQQALLVSIPPHQPVANLVLAGPNLVLTLLPPA